MNNVVLKGKLGAGFNDDRYTLPKDGNPGDILVKTETGSEWQKQEPVETLPNDGNPGDVLVKTETGSAWEKQEPATSTPDWNQNYPTASDYIKNRPFYTSEVDQTEVVPEQTYTLSSNGSFAVYADESGTYPYSLEDGKNYIVVYNGTTYKLKSINADGLTYVGDMGPLQGIEATVPFLIIASNGILQIADYNGSTEVTFKIISYREDVTQIDLKYIPELPIYMSKQNPVGYGCFSLNRKADTTVGVNSHAEGENTTASGSYSHSEGSWTIASGSASHAEGWYTEANAEHSHAEGDYTIVSTTETIVPGVIVEDGMGKYGHAEGFATVVTGQHGAHAEGCKTLSSGKSSHAEGYKTTASGSWTHAEGYYTKASGNYSHVQGKYNIDDTDGKYADIVGNGTSASARSNAHTLDWEGNAWYAGTVEGTAMIVKSSTPDSTKKFKITVGDDARPTFTDTSNPNNTWTPGGSSRYIINGHSWNYNGVNYICTDETPDQIAMMYESGKDIFLDFNEERFKYTGSLFYTIIATNGDNTGIKGAAIAVLGRPTAPSISWNCPYKGVCNFGVFPFNIQSEG